MAAKWPILLLLVVFTLPGLRTEAEPLSAREVAERLERRFENVKEYEVVMEGEICGKKDRSSGVYRIWRRRPDRFRVRVERGDHRGSEIALSGEGGVRARPGGFLKKLVTTSMSREDRRLRTPRGGYPWDSCLERQYQLLQERLQLSKETRVRPAGGEPRVELELTYREPSRGTTMREVWTVDTREWLLVGQDIFEEGKQVERIRYRDFRLNPGLKDSELTL
jgi:outer membrane lipoprotein-sorting protein